MPVYNKNRLVHIHIPKTGGTAIENQFHKLGDLTAGRTGWIGQEYWSDRWYEYQHLSLTELHALSNAQYMAYDSFAVVRDPYQRLLSDYLWRNAISKAYPDAPNSSFSSFDSFIRSIPKDINTNWPGHIHHADQEEANFLIHIRPQYQYVTKYDELAALDHILKFENLKTDITKIFTGRDIDNSEIRNGVNKNISEYYQREHLDIVNEIYERDFLIFSYEMV